MNPPRRNPLDSAKYREQYLSNLRLQASNDQRNQNANLVFKNTGQTPSRPPDMRTTTERASDIEALKVDLRSKLGQITDGVIASQIIGELSPDQIRFAVDKWGTIEPDMRKSFATGVPSSAFIAYLNRLIQKYQITEGVETGLQQSAGEAILLSNTQILYGLPREQIWSVLNTILDRVSRQFGINVSEIKARMDETASLVPTKREQQIVASLPPDRRADIEVLATQIFNNFPSNKDISDIIGELNIGMANRDRRYTESALGDLLNVITTEPSVLDQMAELRGILADFIAEQQGIMPPQIDPDADELPDGNVNPFVPPPISVPRFEELSESIGQQTPQPTPQRTAEEIYNAQPRMFSYADWERLGTRNKETKVLFLNARLAKNPDLILTDDKGKEYGVGVARRGFKFFESNKATNSALNHAYEDYMGQTNLGMEGNGLKGKMKGKGLAPAPKQKVVKPYRQSIAHLVDKPVEKPKPYTQFGRYFINKHRLEGEGIVAFRQPSGNTIGSLPTEKVSRPLAKVIRTLVGKGIPSYEDINDLSKEDKNKLHHICKTCKVESPAVPKCMKGEGQQEEDRFNILRGEIIAGNDNPKIAKEFKVILMKFMNEGRIPKRQANEILQELLALGH